MLHAGTNATLYVWFRLMEGAGTINKQQMEGTQRFFLHRPINITCAQTEKGYATYQKVVAAILATSSIDQEGGRRTESGPVQTSRKLQSD